ncbi:hypothetical protein D3C75_740420 [compost metagenome]
MFEGVQHPADVRLRNRIAPGGKTSCQLPLRERSALWFEHGFEFGYRQRTFDEGELAVQIAFSQMAEQGGDFIAPGAEQAMNAEEAFIAGFLPQLAENRQARITAVADDEIGFTRAAGNRRWLIQPAFTDRGLDILIQRITDEARVVFVGSQLLQSDQHRRISEWIGHPLHFWTRSEVILVQPVGDLLLTELLHRNNLS